MSLFGQLARAFASPTVAHGMSFAEATGGRAEMRTDVGDVSVPIE